MAALFEISLVAADVLVEGGVGFSENLANKNLTPC